MRLRMVTLWVAVVLGASGVLLIAASWQRWAGSCDGADECLLRQDHLYDFLPPAEPWQQAGSAAQLGGLALLILGSRLPAAAVGPDRPSTARPPRDRTPRRRAGARRGRGRDAPVRTVRCCRPAHGGPACRCRSG